MASCLKAGVAEQADAQDLKSCGTNLPYRFDSGRRHFLEESTISVMGWSGFFFFCRKRERSSFALMLADQQKEVYNGV